MADSVTNAANAAAVRLNDYQVGNAQSSKADALSSLAFRKLLNNSAAPIGSSVPAPAQWAKYSGNSEVAKDDGNGHGFLADTMNNLGKAAQTPVIKQILDALSVGTYSSANAADDALNGIDKVGKGDLSGLLDIAAAPVTGIGKGISAATGNHDSVKTYADVIKHVQDDIGVDSNNDAAKWIQGIGGFVGDVALDPTTYLTLGVGPAAKGLTRGFVEGGKRAAELATKGVKDAAEVGEAVAPNVQKIADNADNAGLLNRFKQAGVEAKGDYKQWMQDNGGKIAKWELPFKGSSNPKEAAAIDSVNMADDKAQGLKDLIPAEPVAATKVMPETPVAPIKTPEALAEEKTIADGIEEASKPAPGTAPIVDDSVKQEAEKAKEPTVDLEAIKHENMQSIMDTVRFSKPTYGDGTLIKAVSDAHDAAKPQFIDGEAPVAKVTDTGAPDHNATLKALKDSPQALFKMGPKSLSKNEVVKRYLDAGRSGNPQAVNAFWKSLPENIRQTVKKTEKGEATAAKEIPGTPVDWNDPVFSKIHPDHRELSVDELKAHRSPAGDMRSMRAYIDKDASKEEIAHLTEKLGLPKFADKNEIKNTFEKQYREYQARTKEKIAQAKVDAKAAPKVAHEAVGEGNQATAQLLDKVPVNQTILRRANRAIDSHAKLTEPIEGSKIKNEFIDKRDMESMAEKAMNAGLAVQGGKGRPHKFGTVATDTVDKTTGTAIHTDKWGTQSAVAIHHSLIDSVKSIADGYLKKSGERLPAYAKMMIYRRGMESAMANIRAMGVAPYLDLGRGGHKYGVNLGMDDLAQIFSKDMESHFFAGPMKGMQPQAFSTGVEALIRGKLQGKTEEQIVKDIMDAFTGSENVYKGKFKDADGIMQGMDMTSIVNKIKGVTEDGKLDPKAQGMANAIAARVKAGASPKEAKAAYLTDLKSMADKWAKNDNLYQSLNNRMILNAKEHAAEMGAMVDRVSDDTMRIVEAAAKQPISAGNYIEMMKKAYEAGKKALGEADETKYLLWEQAAKEARDKWMTVGEQATVKNAETVSKLAETPAKEMPKAEEKIKVENTKNVEPAKAEAQEAAAEEAKANIEAHADATSETMESFYDVHGGAVSIDTMRRIHPVSSFFNPKFGLDASGMFRAMGTGLHTQVRMQSIFHGGVMNYLAKNPGKLLEDWKSIQNEALAHVGSGKDASAFLPSSQSAKDLYKVVNMVFDPSKDNIITRNGIGAKHWNAVAKDKGLDLVMDESKTMLENSRAWLEHEGLDSSEKILEFLSKSHAVSTNIANDIAMASSFARTFGSAVPKDGHALLNWSKRGVSKNKTAAAGENAQGFFDLLPKTVYYNKEASRDIANIHRILNESRSLKTTGPMGSFMNNVFNPITNIMKASQTIVRPGHWVNNTLGDVMRNYLAGVSSLTPYRHTLAMMKANGKEMKAFGDNPLEAYKWHKATTEGDFEVHGRGNGVVVHVGGKPQKVSYESLYRLMQDGPIMQKHHGGGVAEDFMARNHEDTSAAANFGNKLDSIQNKVLDNDAFSLNNLAATRDNFSRITLALDHAMKGKFKDIHELKASMEEQVLKWVPTSTDMTAREAKYLRPAFMYYTWLRGVTPRIVDTLMNKPGVALAPSKALYNAAVAGGIDPVSFGNPFPPDAQMPSYYFNNVIGPLMHGEGTSLWGINIANPVTDVMDQLGAGITPGGVTDGSNALNMGKTLLSSASPFAKIPIDLATQQSNGVPIQDPAQYLQDALTGSYGGLISKSTGKLITGQGRTDTANGPMHGEDQSNVAALQIANFLSGLKITDYNSPAAMRAFRGEQKANASSVKADIRRNQ